MDQIDVTDSAYAVAAVVDGVFMGAASGTAAQFNSANFEKCRTPVTITANATLTIAALYNTVLVNSASAVTATIPPVADVPWPLGAKIRVVRMGAGEVTIGAGSGVTRRSGVASGSAPYRVAYQYSVIDLTHVATNEWVLSGERKV